VRGGSAFGCISWGGIGTGCGLPMVVAANVPGGRTADIGANVGVDGGNVESSNVGGCSEAVPRGSAAGGKPGGLGAAFPISRSGAASDGSAAVEDEDAKGKLSRMVGTA